MKTRLDHWLSNLTLRHEVRCTHLPAYMPACVSEPIRLRPNGTIWQYKVACPNDRALEVFIATLKRSRLSYDLETISRTEWWAKLLNPRGSSLTYNVVWGGFNLAVLGGLVWGAVSLAVRMGAL